MQKKSDRTVRCVYCGREFIEPIPHRCSKNYRKRHLKWINLMEVEEKRKQFNAEEFISNEKTPVETRSGRKVEIFTTTREKEDTYVVVGVISDKHKSECEEYSDYYTSWTKEGRFYSTATESSGDLFFSVKKKTRRMTNRELAWWLMEHPEEHREVCQEAGDSVSSRYSYWKDGESCPCPDTMLIRRNGGKWEEPLIEIKEENDKRD